MLLTDESSVFKYFQPGHMACTTGGIFMEEKVREQIVKITACLSASNELFEATSENIQLAQAQLERLKELNGEVVEEQ